MFLTTRNSLRCSKSQTDLKKVLVHIPDVDVQIRGAFGGVWAMRTFVGSILGVGVDFADVGSQAGGVGQGSIAMRATIPPAISGFRGFLLGSWGGVVVLVGWGGVVFVIVGLSRCSTAGSSSAVVALGLRLDSGQLDPGQHDLDLL